MFFLDCTILHFSGCHFLDTLRPFQRIKYSIFSGLLWKGWGHELKSNFRSFSGWKYSMTLWMKYSTVHCKLENWNQEEKFYGEILKNSNLPTNLNFLFKSTNGWNIPILSAISMYVWISYMWIKRKLFKAKYLTRCLESRNFSNLLVFFISEYFGMNYSKLNIWIKYTGK